METVAVLILSVLRRLDEYLIMPIAPTAAVSNSRA